MESTVASRHQVHWDCNGTHVFKVQNTLYKLDAKTIARGSRMLEDLLSIPQPPIDINNQVPIDGTEESPIFIPNFTEAEFDYFVAQTYAIFMLPPANDVLIRLLHLSRFLVAESLQRYTVHTILSRKWSFHPAQLVQLGLEFNQRQCFESGFKRLVFLRFHELTLEHKRMLGSTVFQAMAEVKEVLDEHRRIVAAEPPAITTHADDCRSAEHCSNDWFAAWWNGMARFLLDGRNPLDYDDAVKRFEDLKFGMMGTGCKKLMLDLVKEGSGFRHANQCVDDVTARLADSMIR